MSTGQPLARQRANSAASQGPPMTMTTVLMFYTHCGATGRPQTFIQTLPTA